MKVNLKSRFVGKMVCEHLFVIVSVNCVVVFVNVYLLYTVCEIVHKLVGNVKFVLSK